MTESDRETTANRVMADKPAIDGFLETEFVVGWPVNGSALENLLWDMVDQPLARIRWHVTPADDDAGIPEQAGFHFAEDQVGTIAGALSDVLLNLHRWEPGRPVPKDHGMPPTLNRHAVVLLLAEAHRLTELADIAYRFAYADRTETGSLTIRDALRHIDRALAGADHRDRSNDRDP